MDEAQLRRYEGVADDVDSAGAAIRELVAQVRELSNRIEELEAEIEQLQQEQPE